jgi:hypothetical protein
MIVVEDVKRKRSLRPSERCRVPLDTQKLAVVLDPLRALRARAELDVNAVDPVAVNNNNGLTTI